MCPAIDSCPISVVCEQYQKHSSYAVLFTAVLRSSIVGITIDQSGVCGLDKVAQVNVLMAEAKFQPGTHLFVAQSLRPFSVLSCSSLRYDK